MAERAPQANVAAQCAVSCLQCWGEKQEGCLTWLRWAGRFPRQVTPKSWTLEADQEAPNKDSQEIFPGEGGHICRKEQPPHGESVKSRC